MRKAGLQLLIMLVLFFGSWLTLYQFNWRVIFTIEKISLNAEARLGNLFWDNFRKSRTEVLDERILLPMDSLLSKLCLANDIDRSQLKLHLVLDEEVNAFALPNHHLVLFSGLIQACENEAELVGVMAHELSHIEKGHVLKKITKDVGLSLVIAMIAGNNGNGVKEITRLLTSSAYDRKLEKEADLSAVDYLRKAAISPVPFADLMSRLSENESQFSAYVNWLGSHPNSSARAKYIREHSQDEAFEELTILQEDTWRMLKIAVENTLDP